ncbi:MAG TPA: hypothetical protein VJ801_07340 [Polyangia bacterium]|jgi:hypothetical protein|nr:hypothetical protein [Polyangia bacterium]
MPKSFGVTAGILTVQFPARSVANRFRAAVDLYGAKAGHEVTPEQALALARLTETCAGLAPRAVVEKFLARGK